MKSLICAHSVHLIDFVKPWVGKLAKHRTLEVSWEASCKLDISFSEWESPYQRIDEIGVEYVIGRKAGNPPFSRDKILHKKKWLREVCQCIANSICKQKECDSSIIMIGIVMNLMVSSDLVIHNESSKLSLITWFF